MMSVRLFLVSHKGGLGYAGMTRQKQPKQHHMRNISGNYDGMTKVMVSRARKSVFPFSISSLLSLFLTRSSKEYNHNVISVRNNWMMMFLPPYFALSYHHRGFPCSL